MCANVVLNTCGRCVCVCVCEYECVCVNVCECVCVRVCGSCAFCKDCQGGGNSHMSLNCDHERFTLDASCHKETLQVQVQRHCITH